MMRRFGLQARFIVLVAVALVVSATALGLLLQRQWAMRNQVLDLSRESIQHLVLDRLREQAQSVGTNTAEALVNPLYNFDLEIIGRVVRDVLVQPDVKYVTVYDTTGATIHDGTDAIAGYGQVMSDALAARIIAADQFLMQREGDVIDVAAPIRIGDQRLGGVRIGYSLESARRYEDEANRQLGDRLTDIGRRYFFGVLGLLGLALAVGIFISVIMQRILIRPIRRLAGAAREIEAGNLIPNLPGRDSGDEIGELVQAFERMTEGIARRDRDIRRIANTDALTGLANRRAFRESVEDYASQAADRQFALVLADIDDFKPVNDSLGHDAGDKLLCRFAERFCQVVDAHKDIEAIPARLGGDEFILLVRVAAGRSLALRDALVSLGDDLVSAFSQPTSIDGNAVGFSASFGIALFPEDAGTTSQLMKASDVAMYEAKRAGKNRYRFSNQSRAAGNPG
ncbi:MAG TPA: diguanylate cyclase [Dokdonella sp.]|nr:diguanylate cyclase [Dokdonella sp.]